jgi:plasmid stabilization system protein ParE
MAKKIVWTATAQNDRKAIYTYWNNRNQSTVYSRKLHQLLTQILQLLQNLPEGPTKAPNGICRG